MIILNLEEAIILKTCVDTVIGETSEEQRYKLQELSRKLLEHIKMEEKSVS